MTCHRRYLTGAVQQYETFLLIIKVCTKQDLEMVRQNTVEIYLSCTTFVLKNRRDLRARAQKRTAKKINFEDFKKYIDGLATSKKIEPKEIEDKLVNCGRPGLSSATKAAHAGVVERLTDTSKYTGSHKERFDSTGKGRGIEGRRDKKDTSGYTAAFKTKVADKPEMSTSPSPVPDMNTPV
ncbi:unnamed protein product [Allacma fusca]|uniref:Uncharacterized protein n=1 Tax=Allacma fusca TaxID=39272 RepID=A0A8J2JE45_9HEXA|nr:unnamed protein product [Allacma fusca]